MDDSWLAAVNGMRQHEPLSRHGWYRIGGPARYFLQLSDSAPLRKLIPRLIEESVRWMVMGAGTNTLFPDGGFNGLIVKLEGESFRAGRDRVFAGAGYPMPRLALESAKRGLAGLEFGAGVPGTVGGSVFGNAGAFGTDVKDHLYEVELIDPEGRSRTVGADECAFSYRDSGFKSGSLRGYVITGASFACSRQDSTGIRQRIRQVQRHRRETQPIDKRSLGSTFKNPPGEFAGRLIEACGLKGRRAGGAQISPKHANFIVNLGGARADDVLALVAEMQARVLDRFGIELEPEVRIVGDNGVK